MAGVGRGTHPRYGIGGTWRGIGIAGAALGHFGSSPGLARYRFDARAWAGLWRGGRDRRAAGAGERCAACAARAAAEYRHRVVRALKGTAMNLFKQLFAVSSISLRGLPQRAASSLVIVIGTAGVVAVLLSVLALSTGLAGALTATGRADRAIVLHAQAANEIGSNLPHAALATILDAPGIAKDE